MSARNGRFGVFSPGSNTARAAGAVIACAVMLLAGCGGSAADAGAPVIRGDAGGDTCEPATGSWTATAAVGGVTRTVIFTAPTHTSPWTKFTATANTGQSAEITSSAASGSIQLRGLTKKANNTFIVTGTTADGCTYTSPPSITVSGVVEAVVAPGVPTIATVTAGDAKATVTVAAATTGGTPASYAVTASPAVTGGACTVTGDSGSCDVTGLTNGTAYTFTAAATNAGGTSGASGASASVTPLTVPGAPVIGAVAAAGSTSTSATVAFTAPASNGGSAITTYTATSNTGANTGTVSQAGSGTITVIGLTANTPYTFTVTATNTKGTSAPSDASTSVTLVTAPAAPATPTVVAGASKVTVTVAAGTSGGTPVSYTVTAYAAGKATGGTCTVTGVSVSCDVTGLTSGTAYTFKATATNTKGTSAASGASASATPLGVPGAPVIGTATATGPTTATVAFTAPSSDGGSPITLYTATSYPAGGTGTLTQAGSGTITVTGLTAGVTYEYFTVTATSIAGPSLASAHSESPYRVGTYGPGGGIVFYAPASGLTIAAGVMADMPRPKCATTKTGCHYFEWLRAEPTSEAWCDITTRRPGTTQYMLGYGFSNTSAMARECTSGAGVTVWNSESGGVNDWFLPSIEELKLLKSSNYGGRMKVALLEAGRGVWSSSEDARQGWGWIGVYFLNYDESQNNTVPLPLGDRTKMYAVLQVRAF